MKHGNKKVALKLQLGILAGALCLAAHSTAFAKDIDYNSGEVTVRVAPGEPTQLEFPGKISGGFRKKASSLSIEPKDDDLVIFANENLSDTGEAIIVRLDDGRSYSVRVSRATNENPRDDVVTIHDKRVGLITDEEEDPAYLEKKYDYAPPTQVSGFMREMVLAAEFGKNTIPGYRVSEQYKGQTVLNDGTIKAVIDRIYIGPNLWGYVLDTSNLLEQGQKINPASFRIDGTRAVSAKNWELAPVPLNIEQQLSEGHRTKVYIITRAKK